MARSYGVYTIYGPADVVLYVGISQAVKDRLVQHKRNWWYPQVSRIEVAEFTNPYEAAAAEAGMIHEHLPMYNKHFSGGLSRSWADCRATREQYDQYHAGWHPRKPPAP